MKTISLVTFHTAEPARRLCDRLRRASIPAFIHDESKLERFWFMSEPLAAFHVEVAQPDYLTARRLVEEWDAAAGELKEAVRCPDCRSSRVEFPQISRKFASPVVEAFLMVLHIMPREFYCQDCHFTWPKELPVETERDGLGWPVKSRIWHPEHFRKAKRA